MVWRRENRFLWEQSVRCKEKEVTGEEEAISQQAAEIALQKEMSANITYEAQVGALSGTPSLINLLGNW